MQQQEQNHNNRIKQLEQQVSYLTEVIQSAGLAEEFEEFDGDLGISRPDNFGNNYRYWRNHLSTEINLDSGRTITALA